jgi:GNAT superfamily N-acetyltransferase
LFTDWSEVPGWEDMGYPIAECRADGTAVIAKPFGTGGIVTPAPVAEQILDEIGGPGAYVMPDVVCDGVSSLRLDPQGKSFAAILLPLPVLVPLAWERDSLLGGPVQLPAEPALTWTYRVAVVIIRDFEDGDWQQVYRFFAAIVAAGETYAYPPNLSVDQARGYWVASPPGRTVVAADGAEILGSATMGRNRPGRGAHVATASFMVDPARQRRGVGRALGLYVIDWARAAGFRGIQFNAVVETNHAAVRLWQSLGFEILATVPEAFEHRTQGFVGLHLMFQRLTP